MISKEGANISMQIFGPVLYVEVLMHPLGDKTAGLQGVPVLISAKM